MDNIRVFLWLTLLGMAWLTYTAWRADYAPPPSAVTRPAQPATQNGPPSSAPPSLAETPEQPLPAQTPDTPPAPTGVIVAGTVENFVPVTDAMLRNPDPEDWLMLRHDYSATSFSPSSRPSSSVSISAARFFISSSSAATDC